MKRIFAVVAVLAALPIASPASADQVMKCEKVGGDLEYSPEIFKFDGSGGWLNWYDGQWFKCENFLASTCTASPTTYRRTRASDCMQFEMSINRQDGSGQVILNDCGVAQRRAEIQCSPAPEPVAVRPRF